MFTYHYAAFRSNREGQTTWLDGIAQFEEPIIAQDQYLKLKSVIAEQMDVPEKGLVLTSLSLIQHPAVIACP